MSFKDKIGDAWDWVKDSSASIGSAFMNWDPKAMGWVHDVNRFADSTPLGKVAGVAGNPALGAVNAVMNTATRPASTFYQTVGSMGQGFSWQDTQPLFDPDVWKRSWERSAPSYEDETGQHEGVSYAQALIGAAVPGTAGPSVKPEARYRFFHDTWYGQLSSGGIDLFVSLAADPLYAAGKIGKAKLLENATIAAGDIAPVVAASAGSGATLTKTQSRKLQDFDSFLDWTKGKSAAENYTHEALKENAEGGTYAYLLAQADKLGPSSDVAHIKRTLLGAAIGDGASIEILKKQQALLANDLYRLSSTPGFTLSSASFNHATGGFEDLVRANIGTPVEIESQKLAIERELERLGRLVDGAATTRTLAGTGGQNTRTVADLGGLRTSTIYSGLGNRPIHVIAGSLSPHLPGKINLRDPAVGFKQLDATLKQCQYVSGTERRDMLDKWLKATSDGDRQGVVHEAEAFILEKTGANYGVAKDDVLTVARHGETRRRAVVANLKSRLYSADSSAKFVYVVDPTTGNITAVSRPLLRSQIEDHEAIIDPRNLDKALRAAKQQRVLENVGRYFGNNALDAATGTYRGLDWMGELTSAGLQSLTKIWKDSTLLLRAPAYGTRVQIDEQARVMVHLGFAQWLLPFMRSLKNQGKYATLAPVIGDEAAMKKALAPSLAKMGFAPDEMDGIISKVRATGGGASGVLDELANSALQKFRATGQWGTLHGEHEGWLDAWGRDVVQIQHSPAAMKFVEGATPAEVKRFIRTDPAGRKEWLELSAANNNDLDDWIQRVQDHVDHYLPDPEMRVAALQGKIYVGPGSDAAKKWFVDVNNRMPVHGEGYSPFTGHPIAEFYNKSRQKMYEYVTDAPSTIMARMPLYLASYNRNLRSIIERLNLNKVPGTPDIDLTIPSAALDSARKEADRMARREVGRVQFDVSDVSNLAYSMRFVAPFFAAWEDMIKKWGNLFYENPHALERFRQMWNIPEATGLATDENGNLINSQGQHMDRNTGEVVTDKNLIGKREMIRFPVSWIPKSWRASADLGDELRVDKKSFNIIFQGDPWWLPGFGPLVQIPANEVVKRAFPESADNPIIKKVLPFGITNENPVQQAMPSWARHLTTGKRWLFGDEKAWAEQMSIMAREEYLRQQQAGIANPDVDLAKIANQTKNWFLLRMALGMAAPVSVQPSHEMQFYIDQGHIYQQKYGQVQQSPEYKATLKEYTQRYGTQGRARLLYDHPEYTDALERFRQDFPEYFDLAISISTNETGIVATDRAVSAARRWSKEIAAAPELGWAIVGPDNAYGFSSAAHTWELGTEVAPGTGKTFRSYEGDPIEALKRAEREKGWAEFQKSRTALNLELERRGLHSLQQKGAADLKAAWGKYVDDLAKWNVHWAEDYQQNDESKALSTLNQALKVISGSKSLAERQDMQAIQLYAQARNALMAELEKRGGTLAAEKNADLEAAWHSYVQQLIQWSPGFEQIWSRALQNDNLTLPTAGAYPQE